MRVRVGASHLHLQAHVVQGPEKNTVLDSVAAEKHGINLQGTKHVCNKRVVY